MSCNRSQVPAQTCLVKRFLDGRQCETSYETRREQQLLVWADNTEMDRWVDGEQNSFVCYTETHTLNAVGPTSEQTYTDISRNAF